MAALLLHWGYVAGLIGVGQAKLTLPIPGESPMAWLQTDPSGNYRISFRFAGRKFKRSLKTKNGGQAERRLARLEENVQLVDSSRLELPPGADAALFLLSDGKICKRPVVVKRVGFADLFTQYFDSVPEGSLEATTIKGMKLHQRHLERHIGVRFPVETLTRDTLQNYVRKRSGEKGIRGRALSAATIKKELVTLRSVWNWALAEGLVAVMFPLKGVRFPKSDEKPHFQTWEEIVGQIDRGGLDAAQMLDLWDCLFLTRAQTEELLDHVEATANHPFIYPMFVAAAHSGARRSELMRSQLSDINATHLVIR